VPDLNIDFIQFYNKFNFKLFYSFFLVQKSLQSSKMQFSRTSVSFLAALIFISGLVVSTIAAQGELVNFVQLKKIQGDFLYLSRVKLVISQSLTFQTIWLGGSWDIVTFTRDIQKITLYMSFIYTTSSIS
jgi:hypothetical protein